LGPRCHRRWIPDRGATKSEKYAEEGASADDEKHVAVGLRQDGHLPLLPEGK
jgi:hypothetical protein